MPDPIFSDTRLVALYDAFDGPRPDLAHYLAIASELGARSVLDVGCGTGSFACMLAEAGYEVIGLEPAAASLDCARTKPFADRVHWIQGYANALPKCNVDLAVMTGNVAQVFLTDAALHDTLTAIHRAVRTGGHIVFETRDPAQTAWHAWTREKTFQRINIPNLGYVSGWCAVTDVSDGTVSFRWTYEFESNGQTLVSDSVLRFWEKDQIAASLAQSRYKVKDIRGAPDRPNQEFVFIAEAI